MTKIITMTSIAALFAVLVTSTSFASAEEAPEFLFEWGSEGTGDGQFTRTSEITIDSDGDIYVADQHNHRIQKFDSNGTYLAQFGSVG